MKNARKIVIAMLVASMPALASAQGKMPTAKEVMAKFIKATGGKEAYAKVKTYRVKGKMSMLGQSMGVEMQGRLKPAAEMYQAIDLGQFGGKMEQFFMKDAAWSNSIQGQRLVTGKERSQGMRQASLATELNPEKHYKSMKVTGKEQVKEEECYKVEAMPKDGGKPEIHFYSVKSGLKLKSIITAASPQGEMKIESFSADYRKVEGGPMMAFVGETKLPQGTMKMTTEKVEINKPLDDGKFKVPADIKEKAQAAAAKEKKADK